MPFSCLNLYLQKEKVCLHPQLLYYSEKEKKIAIRLQNTFFKLLNKCII